MILLMALTVVSCSTIAENVEIDTDAILASTCQQLADGLSEKLVEAVTSVEASSDFDLPDVDIAGLIDRAEILGCSPDDMRAIVADAIQDVETTSSAAQEWLDELEMVAAE